MKVSQIKNPVSSISGIGPQLTKCLAKLNVFTVGDLLEYYPRNYDDRTKRIFLKDFASHQKVHTVAKVVSHQWFGYGNMKTLKIIIDDSSATAELICFNRQFLEKVLTPGSIITVTGQFYVKYNSLQSSSFEAVKMNVDSDSDIANVLPLDNRVVPVYPLTEGLTQKALQKAISQAISQYSHGIENEIPDDLIEKHGLLQKQQAIRFIHEPQTMQQAFLARKTLSYEELFLFQSTLLKRMVERKGIPKINDEEILNPFENDKNEIQIEDFYASLSLRENPYDASL